MLTSVQQRLRDHAVEILKPGAALIYCVCSLEPEEGENQIDALLARDPRIVRKLITAPEVFDRAEFITAAGDLRTLPLHFSDSDPRWGGLMLHAARLTRKLAHSAVGTGILALSRPSAIVARACGLTCGRGRTH